MLHTDVAIVGGGPGGLAACAAVLKKCPELKVRVFERETALRRVGNFIALEPNGQRALKAVQPKLWEKVQQDMKSGRSNTLLAWYKLRQRLSEVLPKECLKLGYTLQDLVQSDDGVDLKFSPTEESYHAKVVIGCDGYRSLVREVCLQDGLPTFKNKICWRGIIEWPKYWPHEKDKVIPFRSNQNKLMVLCARLDEEVLGWQSVFPVEGENWDFLSLSRSVQIAPSGEECKKRCLDALGGILPELMINVIKDTPPDSLTEHGIFARHPDSCSVWGKGSITLLGDAAHVSSPALGQGTNQALMDAVELGRAMGDLGPCDEALRQYEDVRISAVRPVQQGSWDITDGLLSEHDWHEQNPWCRSQTIEPL